LPGLDPAGCLIVLNDQGTVVETITNKDIVGPWDLAVTSTPASAQVFVSNALGGNTSTSHGTPVTGNCTVVRLDFDLSASSPPALSSTTVVGTGCTWPTRKPTRSRPSRRQPPGPPPRWPRPGYCRLAAPSTLRWA